MKYLLLLLLVSGSVFGRCGIVEDSAIIYDQHADWEIYQDTIEVLDTVWYYNVGCNASVFVDRKLLKYPPCDSIYSTTPRTEIITKQKKQVWLTEDEYDKLMELLHPVNVWELLSVDEINYIGDSLIAR